jgi:glutathione peroxidase
MKFDLFNLRICVAVAALAMAALGHAQSPTQPAATTAATTAAAPSCPALLQQTFNRLQDDKPQALCQYVGKVLLVVNTASFCGYTPQYEGLEALHKKYSAQGLVVMGFPTNDFGQQEPGDAKQIADFCFNTYGVKFPMFAKSSVKGNNINPLFAQLAKDTGKAPGWNFHKYLVDRQGKAVANFGSKVTPDDAALVAGIEKALAAK